MSDPILPTRTSADTNSSADVNALSTTPLVLTDIDDKGDMLIGSASETVSRLSVGSNDQVLTADSSETTGVKWATPSGGGGGSDGVAFYLSGSAYVGNGITRINIPKSATVTKILARVITAPTGSALTLNVRKNSDSTNDISTSDLSITAGTNTANSTTLSATHKVFAENDYITIAVTGIGSTVAGADLMVTLIY